MPINNVTSPSKAAAQRRLRAIKARQSAQKNGTVSNYKKSLRRP